MNNKGISEIISQILLLLITVIVIGIIIGALVPQITKSQSRINFEESKRVRDNIYSNIQEVYNNPIGYTKEINLALENLTLVIDADTNSIEVYSLIDGDFYKDNFRQDETSEKYTYRKGQKVYAGFTLSNINLVRSYVLENVTRTSIYLRKTDKEKITVLLENVTEDSWFTSSNLGLYTENPSTWLYRKKILIDGNKVDGNLTNFPVLIYLEDEDLKLYAKEDGSDIIFTDENGNKLKREIENYNQSKYYFKKIIIDPEKVEETTNNFILLLSITDSDLIEHSREDGKDIYFTASNNSKIDHEIEYFNKSEGKLVAWIIIPETSSTIDTEIRMYFGETIFDNFNNIWDENYVFVHHLNEFPSNDQINGFLDSSIYSNHGTAVGFSDNQYSNTDSNGIIDGAIILDVNNNYIYFNNAEHVDLKKTDKFTISGWIKRDSSNSGSYENTLTHNGWGPWSVVSDDGNISFIFDDDIKRCETEIVSDQYVNFVFVNDVDNSYGYGDNKLLLYLNGEIANNCPTIDE